MILLKIWLSKRCIGMSLNYIILKPMEKNNVYTYILTGCMTNLLEFPIVFSSCDLT